MSLSNKSAGISDTPIFNAYKAVKEEYNRLLEDLLDETRPIHDWSYKLKTFSLPRSDKSLLEKGDYALAKASNHFGKLILKKLESMNERPLPPGFVGKMISMDSRVSVVQDFEFKKISFKVVK